jgi:hypothetical protein
MIFGFMREVYGRGFREILLHMHVVPMVTKEYHHLPMFLELERGQYVGQTMMEIFGCLAVVV